LATSHKLSAIGSREGCPQQGCRVLRVTRKFRDADAAVNGTRCPDNVERFSENQEEADRDDDRVVT